MNSNKQCVARAPSNARASVEHCLGDAEKMLRNATQRNATNATTTHLEISPLRNASRAMENPEMDAQVEGECVAEARFSTPSVAVDGRTGRVGLLMPGGQS
jgi:hypothetical protein